MFRTHAKFLTGATTPETKLSLSRNAAVVGLFTDADCPTTTLKAKIYDTDENGLPLYTDAGEWSMNIQANRAYSIPWDLFAGFISIEFILGVAPAADSQLKLSVRDV